MSSDYPNFLSLRRTALTDDVVQGCVSGTCQPDGLLSSMLVLVRVRVRVRKQIVILRACSPACVS